MLQFQDVQAAAQRLRGIAHRTPVLRSSTLDALLGMQVFMKAENLQRMGAFKFRGGYNAVNVLSDAQRARGVVAFSSGNHAQAVALAAQLHGCKCDHRDAAGRTRAQAGCHPRLRRRGGALRPLPAGPRRDRAAPGGRDRRRADPTLRPPAGDGRPGHGGAGADRRRRPARRADRVRRRWRLSVGVRRRGEAPVARHPGLRRRTRARQRHAAIAARRAHRQHRRATHHLRRPADPGRRATAVRGDPGDGEGRADGVRPRWSTRCALPSSA